MKRRFLLLAVSLISMKMYAQIPEDALRMSWTLPAGTARSQAIGGAVGALGGDISSMFVNPAGLGFFKTGTFVLSPGINFLQNKSNFRGTGATADRDNSFSLGTSGIVVGGRGYLNPKRSFSLGIAINRSADFNSDIYYRGLNDYSSYSEQFLEELRNNNADTNSVYNFPFTSGLAYYTYLIDTLNVNGNVAGFKSLASLPTGLDQETRITSSGGITELALGLAVNNSDKFYFGGTLGFPIVNYKRTTTFREADATNDTDNDFNYSEYIQHYSSKGAGVNLKLGAIFKPIEPLRIGIGFHTPTLYALRERSDASMTTDVENYPPSPGVVSVTSFELNNNESANFKYNLVSPWKFLVSGAYVIGQTENVRNQKGFISADVEYVTYGSSRFSSTDSYDDSDDSYYDAVNDATKASYKGAFNVRVGGELKFNTLMARAGFGYYGNPYKDAELKANRTTISTGLGYRNKGIFIDLAYTYQITKDVHFPYRLADKANTFAAIKGTGSNVSLTFGIKL